MGAFLLNSLLNRDREFNLLSLHLFDVVYTVVAAVVFFLAASVEVNSWSFWLALVLFSLQAVIIFYYIEKKNTVKRVDEEEIQFLLGFSVVVQVVCAVLSLIFVFPISDTALRVWFIVLLVFAGLDVLASIIALFFVDRSDIEDEEEDEELVSLSESAESSTMTVS
jgi:phosphatidylglycerophosphate synthase